MKLVKLLASTIISTVMASGVYAADATHLRIQTHYAAGHPSGKLAQQFADDINVMSNGEISVEMFYSSSVVGTADTFDAAVNGILDCDMTGGIFQVGKNPGFQFLADVMGGYETPWQMYSWLYFGGGKELAQKLYNEQGMEFVGWWLYGQESLTSTRSIANPEEMKGWKFRSPPGLETEIFTDMGATPIVMDFTEVFTAMETGIIDGADASGLANNVGFGFYDIANYATYPGFHSMTADHLSCNKDVWDGMPESHKRIIDTAMQKLAFQTTLSNEKANAEAAKSLLDKGVVLQDWSPEDRAKFRATAQQAWDRWAKKSPEAAALIESHREYLGALGLLTE